MTIRLALALLVIVAAAMAYPWRSTVDWWVLGVAAAVLIVVFAWWRGQFVTTMVARRLAVLRRNHSQPSRPDPNRTTVVVHVADPTGAGLPLTVPAAYVERFGLRSERVAVISRVVGGERTTWVSMTLDAAANLTALQARSTMLPLRETARIAGRRLADHLRETGLAATVVDVADSPISGSGKEMWSGVRDGRGAVSVYAIPVDEHLTERLTDVWAQPTETWSAVEFGGTARDLTVAAVCAIRTAESVRTAPLPFLVALRGRQRPLLDALDPCSTATLARVAQPVPAGLLDRAGWPVGSGAEVSRT